MSWNDSVLETGHPDYNNYTAFFHYRPILPELTQVTPGPQN